MGKTLRNILIASAIALASCGSSSSSGGSGNSNGSSDSGGDNDLVGTVTGRVVFPYAENNGVAYKGLANARVSVVGTDAEAYSDSDGYFYLSNAPTGFQEIEGNCYIYDDCEPHDDTSYNTDTPANPTSKSITIVEDSLHELGDFKLTPFMYRDRLLVGTIYSSVEGYPLYVGEINLYSDSSCTGNPFHNCTPQTLLESSFTDDGYFAFRHQTDDSVLCLSTSTDTPQNEIYFYESDDECTNLMLNDWIFQKEAYNIE